MRPWGRVSGTPREGSSHPPPYLYLEVREHGGRLRRAGPFLRPWAVRLLLALRAGERAVREEGGLRRAGGVRGRPPGPPQADGRVPREGGAGARPQEGQD